MVGRYDWRGLIFTASKMLILVHQILRSSSFLWNISLTTKWQANKRFSFFSARRALVYMWRPKRKWHGLKWRVKDQYDLPKGKPVSVALTTFIRLSLSVGVAYHSFDMSYDGTDFICEFSASSSMCGRFRVLDELVMFVKRLAISGECHYVGLEIMLDYENSSV